MNNSVKQPHPAVAALLNFILPGSAYLYLKKRRLFGWLMIGSYVVSCVWLFLDQDIYNRIVHNPLAIICGLFYLAAFIWDAIDLAMVRDSTPSTSVVEERRPAVKSAVAIVTPQAQSPKNEQRIVLILGLVALVVFTAIAIKTTGKPIAQKGKTERLTAFEAELGNYEDIYLRLVLDKTNITLGEQITASYVYYLPIEKSKTKIAFAVKEEPVLEQATIEEVELPKTTQEPIFKLNDTEYIHPIFKQFRIKPHGIGEFDLKIGKMIVRKDDQDNLIEPNVKHIAITVRSNESSQK